MDENKPEGQKFLINNLTPISIIVAGIIIAASIVFANPPSNQKTNLLQGNVGNNLAQANPQQQPQQPSVNIKDVKTGNEPYLGKADAPVTLAYWSDYQCPFCKQFEETTMANLVTNYVDKGKLKIVFKDYQFLGPDSTTAGLYARAIWQLYPSSYFKWREAMFQKQDQENSGFGDEASIVKLTQTISGINTAKVSQLVTQKKADLQSEIDADKTEGTNFGVRGTPGFITGTTLIPGALPYSNFSQVIDSQLK